MWTSIIGKGFTIPELRVHIATLDFKFWRPSLVVWHNTAAPTLVQWQKTAADDRAAGRPPGITRIRNLEAYFRDQRKWSSGPHAFVADDLIWLFTPFTAKGTHSPSWNGTSIGIEMVADFDKEDDETGAGLKVRQNTVALTALLCEKLGLDPATAIKLHREDPRTDHACPGKNIARDKLEMIDEVFEYMGHGGDHVDDAPPFAQRTGTVDVPLNDVLNMREKSSASSQIVRKLVPGAALIILEEAMNGQTKWLFVQAGTTKGWVAARYVKET